MKPLAFPAALQPGDYTLGNFNKTPNFTVNADGSLTVTSKNISGQSGAFLNNARLPDGGSFSVRFTVDVVPWARFGILISDQNTLPIQNGFWFAFGDDTQDGSDSQRVKMLQFNNSPSFGPFTITSPDSLTSPGPAFNAGQAYTLAVRRAGQVLTFSIDGADVAVYNIISDIVGEEPYVGAEVRFFGAQRTYTVAPQPVGNQVSTNTVTCPVLPNAEIRVIRAGRPCYDLGAVGARNVPASSLQVELSPIMRDGSNIRLAGQSLVVPAGCDVQAVAVGAPLPGVILGLGELATDATMPLWDGVTLAGQASTTVDPATKAIKMLCKPGSGYAFKTKAIFDQTKDVTLEYYATLEQVTGSKAWLGGVLWCYEVSIQDANYIGVNINRDITGPTSGAAMTAMYGDEKFTNRRPYVTPLGEEHHHRLIWDAAGKRILWFMDGVFRSAKPWTPTRVIKAWIGSVAQDDKQDPAHQSRATFRDVRIIGTPATST